MSKALADKVQQTIDRNALLAPGETVVVGVSGGPDSLCLLHVLHQLQPRYGLTLHVAHLNHRLRDVDSDADADFVQSLAASWGLACTVTQADVAALARQQRLALEEAARRARYAFLSGVAQSIGSRTIAVGHNADDQAETVLMHWLRGSGLGGLRGMLPATPLAGYRLLDVHTKGRAVQAGMRLIRPLLETTRSDILVYCDSHGLRPRFDRSNLDKTYFRNWLRHEVIPLLALHNPNIQEVIRHSARVAADDHALLRSLLENAWPTLVVEESERKVAFDLTAWRALPLSLQRSALREAVHRLRFSLRDLSFVHVDNALEVVHGGCAGQRATLPRGLALTMGYDRFVITGADEPEPLLDWPLLPHRTATLSVASPGATRLPESEWMLYVEFLQTAALPPSWEANADPWLAFVDAGSVGESLWLRTREVGDRFQPLGLGGHAVKLSAFLTNEKVPRAVRDRLPLLVSEGRIVWVCGLRLDERARVRDTTERVLVCRLKAT